jgi:hypothetical protein
MGFGEKRQNTIIHDVRYDHINGRFTITDRVLNYGRWEDSKPQEITVGFRAVVDFDNAEMAWFRFIKGQKARALCPVRAHEKLPKKPFDDCSKHVRTLLLLDAAINTNERLRVMMTMLAGLWDALEGAYSAYQREAAAHPGQLPVVECVGVVSMWNGTMQPQFSIVGWVDRPTELPDAMPHTLLDDEEQDNEAAEARASAKGRGRREAGVVAFSSGNGGARRPPGDQSDMEDSIPFAVRDLDRFKL